MTQTPTLTPKSVGVTAADIVEQFGPIPIWRIRNDPAPGEATVDDVERIHLREDRLCELVDGVLVEKTVGTWESYLAIEIASLLRYFVKANRLGAVLGADGMIRLAPNLIRIPDVSFIDVSRLPDGKIPPGPFFESGPDLAVEVISPSNTKREMDRKAEDYFASGVRLVWYVYPVTREVHVFTSADNVVTLDESQTLDGGEVLPGFELKLADLFAELAPSE